MVSIEGHMLVTDNMNYNPSQIIRLYSAKIAYECGVEVPEKSCHCGRADMRS